MSLARAALVKVGLLRARPQGLSRRLPGPVSARAAAAHRVVDRPWRGTVPNLYRNLARIDLLILDDWGWWPSMRPGHAISSKSSTTASAAARQSSPVSCRSPAGTASSRIPAWPMPSSTVSFMAPCASICTAPPCASRTLALEPNNESGRRPLSSVSNGLEETALRAVEPSLRSGASVQAQRSCPGMARAHHAPTSCRRAFGNDVLKEKIAKENRRQQRDRDRWLAHGG